MAKKLEVYLCEICGNIVEVLHGGKGQLICCGQPMELCEENTVDAAKEKHVPVVERSGEGLKVAVGSVPHPMEEKHFIEWIEVIDGESVQRRFLKPGERPEATFAGVGEGVTAREYCNLHGLWKG
jgi:superoxide reductase